MGNYCFLLAGNSDALDANRAGDAVSSEPAVHTIAAQANLLPVLWLQMFDATDLVTAGLGNGDEETDVDTPATVVFRTSRDLALARLSVDPPPFAAIFPPGPALREWCDLLTAAVRESPPGTAVEADLTEYALLCPNPTEFADELRSFFADARRPPATMPLPRSPIARFLLGKGPPRTSAHPAHDFIRNHCPDLDPSIALPSPQQCLADPRRFGPILACLVGGGWDHAAPWEHP
jgi:hypothetical protein